MRYLNRNTNQIVQAFYWNGNPTMIDEQKVAMDFQPDDIAYFKNFTKAMRNRWIVHIEADSYRYQIMQDAEFKAEYQVCRDTTKG